MSVWIEGERKLSKVISATDSVEGGRERRVCEIYMRVINRFISLIAVSVLKRSTHPTCKAVILRRKDVQ